MTPSTCTYAERRAALDELPDEDLEMIAEASEQTIADDRARGFETMHEVRQRLEIARELLDERRTPPACPYCGTLPDQHGRSGECPAPADDYRSCLTTGGCSGPRAMEG